MTFRELLMTEMSRAHTDYVAGLLVEKPEWFDSLWSIFLGKEETPARRAAWVLDLYSERNPEVLSGKEEELIVSLSSFRHGGLKRHALKMLLRTPFENATNAGTLASICFDWLILPATPVAVKANAMDILFRLTLAEPELAPELYESIRMGMDEGSPGYKNHGEKILKKLEKIIPLRD